jgi:histidinol dehydrogenase
MLAIPAEVAGVPRRVLATPAGQDGAVAPTMLVAAAECGLAEVYRIGGAQAIGALAYGTQTIARVDKIVGPGSPYVVLAKREVFGVVGIEALPGPSEALIVADETADPALVAVDLLSQAEHTGDNAVFLVTDAPDLATAVSAELTQLLQSAPRAELASRSLREHGAIILVRNQDAALALANDLAPEHLQLMVDDPLSVLPQIRHAGCVFLGAHSPVPLGDYAAGPSNVLPTDRTARMSSPVGVHDFVRRSSVVFASERGLRDLAETVERLAEGEGLPAHAESIRRRFES